MADGLSYYAVRPCGCLQGVAHVLPGFDNRASAAQYVSRWVKDGFPVHTISVGDVLPPWSCEQHKEKNDD